MSGNIWLNYIATRRHMNIQEMYDKLGNLSMEDHQQYRDEAFSRNIGLLSEEEQDKLSEVCVAIPGLGGVGGSHLTTLTRSGIGRFHLADYDTFEAANVNRQQGATVPDFGRSKLEVMTEKALEINPWLEITPFAEGISEENLDEFLDGVDVVVDSLDFFAFEIRRSLFKRAAEKGIHVVTAGPLGFSTAVLVFDPKGMGFDEYFDITDDMEDEEKYLSFAMGLAPGATHVKYTNLKKVDLKGKAGPSLCAAIQLCAGVAAAETLKIVCNRGTVRPVPSYYQFDTYHGVYKRGTLFWGNRNPIQRIKRAVVKYILQKNRK